MNTSLKRGGKFALALALALCLAAAGYAGGKKEEKTAKGASDVLNIKIAHHLPADHSLNKHVMKFVEIIGQKSNGKIKADIYPNAQLGGMKDLLEALRMGTMDMTYVDTGVLANYDMKIGILDLPYVFKSPEHVRKAMAGEAGKMLKDGVLKTSGIRVLSIVNSGVRHTLMAKKQIQTIADMKGAKIRTPQAPVMVDTFKAFGANPTAMAFSEVYTAVQTGVIDGLEGIPEFLDQNKMYEVAKMWTETAHNTTCNALCVSEKMFAKYPKSAQDIIMSSIDESVNYFYQVVASVDSEHRKHMADNGVKFLTVDLAPYKAAVAPMVKKFIADNKAEDIFKLVKDAE